MTIYPTDTQRLTACIYATGHTPSTFAKAIHIKPETMQKKLNGIGDWNLKTLYAFDDEMKRLSPNWQESDLSSVFFPTSQTRGNFKKCFALAVIGIGLGMNESEAAAKAGIDLETLRSLYNACRTPEQLTLAAKVWQAWGLMGKWDSFYLTFLDYPDTPSA